MKTIKRILMSFLFFVMAIAMAGCGGKVNDEEVGMEENPEVTTQKSDHSLHRRDTITSQNILLDSIGKLSSKVVALEAGMEEVRTKSETLDKAWEEKVGSMRFLVICVGGFCLLCFCLLMVWVYFRVKGLNERLGRHSEELRKLNGKLNNSPGTLANGPGRRGTTSYRGTSNEYYDLANKYSVLAEKVLKLERLVSKDPNPSLDSVVASGRRGGIQGGSAPAPVEAYFGYPIVGGNGSYFKKEMGSRDSDARFVVKIQGDTARFEPIIPGKMEQNTLLTSDQMKKAIEFSGCASSDMKSMRVLTPGIAKREGDKWVIKEKAAVLLKS